jgi:hypothetical protein
MRVRVVGIVEDANEPCVDPARPALRFVGKMRGFSSVESVDRGVTGVVRLMRSGDIRWSSVSNHTFSDISRKLNFIFHMSGFDVSGRRTMEASALLSDMHTKS